MRRLTLLLSLLLLVGCSIAPTATPLPIGGGDVQPTETQEIPTEVPATEPGATATSTAIPTPLAPGGSHVERYLLLGGDFRPHRAGTRYGDKTDVMLLVQITWEPDDAQPARIDVVQFPRNFYYYFGPETVAFPDMWLFHVYAREDFPGLHYYFQRVFDVDLNGIFYINMEHFIAFIDDMFPEGIQVLPTNKDVGLAPSDGRTLLSYLRDNDNNWGCPEYDCGDRQIRTVFAIGDALKARFQDKPVDSLIKLWESYGNLFQTDLSTADQILRGASLAKQLMTRDYQFNSYKLTTADGVVYGDTPLEVRGWIVEDDSAMLTWLWTRLR